MVCAGIYKDDGPFNVMIDITKIKKLHTIPSATEVSFLYCSEINQDDIFIITLAATPFVAIYHVNY